MSFSKQIPQGKAGNAFALQMTVLIILSNITKTRTNTRFSISSEVHMLQISCLQKLKPGMTV